MRHDTLLLSLDGVRTFPVIPANNVGETVFYVGLESGHDSLAEYFMTERHCGHIFMCNCFYLSREMTASVCMRNERSKQL